MSNSAIEGWLPRAARSSCLLILLVLSLPGFSQPRQPAGQRHTLRTISQVYSLSKTEAAKGYPIELDAIVLYSDPEWGSLFVQDRTAATFIDVHGTSTKYPLGARIRVEAVTGAKEDGPMVAHPKITVLGRAVLPKPVRKSIAELDGGTDESYRTITEGILHPCERDYFRACFRLFDGKKAIWLFAPQPESLTTQRLIGAIVQVTGVVGRHADEANPTQRLGAQLYLGSLDDIQVETPPLQAPFASSLLPVRELRAAGDQRFPSQIHLRGVVTWQSPGLFTIRDSTGTLFVGTRKDVVVHTGSTVDAVGFPGEGDFGLELSDSVVRLSEVQQNAAGLAPPRLTAAEIVRQSLNGMRVHLKARLTGQSVNDTEFIYQFQEGGQPFEAVLRRGESTRATVGLAPDSVLELTGVALIRRVNPERPESLLILIESPSDMVVQGGFGWFTLRRSLAILAALALVVIAPFIWAAMLRRTVRSQTAMIRAQLENELHLENRFRRLFERNLAAVFTWRPDGTIVDCNMASARLLGFQSREELIGRSYWDFQVDPDRREQLCRLLQEGALSNREASLRRNDGVTVHVMKNITPVRAAEGTVYETTAIDVTQLRENQAELQRARDAAVHESLNDPLTGLPNRRCLMNELAGLVEKARRESGSFALLYIDLDGFKLVNDSLGHAVGDALLVQVAASLRSWVRGGDFLARLGGDEFLVILDRLQAREDAALVAKHLLDAIAIPFHVKGHDLAIGASIGISVFPSDATGAEELMQQADSAMYAAKREGKNRVLHYAAEIGFQIHERLTLEHLLRGAVARNEISLHYQPEFDLADHRLIRFEALARWTHPIIGVIPPVKFIPIAEESGMIAALGAYILEQACREALRWQKIGHPIEVAVNVSGIQFRYKGFVDEVRAILQRTGLRPGLVQLEVTESAMLAAGQGTEETMMRLRELGISLAIDDFGTGYSNLSYLPTMPFDTLKIDGSFVRNLDAQPESESMIRTLVALAHDIGMKVIIEGVEKQEQLDFVKALGANEVQGYLTGRPTPNPLLVFLSPAVNASEEAAEEEGAPLAGQPG
ncbi:MAG: EAL domain-containing protein [Terracidiphilus sp.]